MRVRILAVDTSTSTAAAAVVDGDSAVLSEDTETRGQRHGEALAVLIQTVLRASGTRPHELSHIVCGVGPGPFTGLRVGVVTATTMAAALGVPCHGVVSLDAWAHGVLLTGLEPAGEFEIITDARRGEVFSATYQGDGQRVAGPRPVAVSEESKARRFAIAAGAWSDRIGVPTLEPTAAWVGGLAARLLRGEHPGSLVIPSPEYLREPDATPLAQTSGGSGHAR